MSKIETANEALLALFAPVALAVREKTEGEPNELSPDLQKRCCQILMTDCPFFQHCRDSSQSLPEPEWKSMVRNGACFGQPGYELIHELSKDYPAYSESETDRKIEQSLKIRSNGNIGPDTCEIIGGMFTCPDTCLNKKLGAKSPAGMSIKLAFKGRNSNLPNVVISGTQLDALTKDTLKALEAANKLKPSLFRFGPGLARIGFDDHNRPFSEQADAGIIRYMLSKVANFERRDAKGEGHDCHPPLELCNNILVARDDWHLPMLLGIVEAPTIRPDFSIISTPGYDPTTGIWYEPSKTLEVPTIPERPSDGELADATTLIQEPLRDFLFYDQSSRANMTAGIFLACTRDAITGPVPLTLITKPQPGCGGSLLVDNIAIIATGRPAHMIPATRDPEEWRKLLTTLLLGGDRYGIFDNIDHPLESEYLASFITALVWKDRLLGQSQPIELPNRTVLFGNGNNARVGGNIARRVVPVRLDSPGAQPWLRDVSVFKHPNLRQWVFQNRGRMISAILTIVRGWVIAGKPKPKDIITLGSFESYSEIIGSLLSFAGVPGFLGNLQDLYAKIDTDTPAWANFFEVWLAELGRTPTTVSDLANKIRENERLKGALPDIVSDMDGKGYTRRLGNQLARRENQKFDNMVSLTRGGEYRHAVQWQVVSFEKQTHIDLASNVSLGSSDNTPYARSNQEIDKKIEYKDSELNSQNSQTRVQGVSLVRNTLPAGLRELWLSKGKPIIFLGAGESCQDLEKLLTGSINERQEKAILDWYEEHRDQSEVAQ